ncbi:MAG TPA: glutathione S-transferase family protein [Steroidobacteraceae bacterium]|jgi:glutathione S-transferase|nr:glutathione S-transferase family protein [Steroidobacteraceae bacterium]
MIEVHHLNNSRSQRVLWMLEELGVPYTVVRYERDAKTMLAPPELRKIHPLGRSPVIKDGDFVLAESGAIVEYLVERYGAGRFVPARGTREYETCRYWVHYAEGSLMMQLLVKIYLDRVGEPAKPMLERVTGAIRMHLGYTENSLGASQFLTGSAFTVADVQMSFPLEVCATQGMLGAEHPRLSALLKRLHQRPAYQAALTKGGPYAYAKEEG